MPLMTEEQNPARGDVTTASGETTSTIKAEQDADVGDTYSPGCTTARVKSFRSRRRACSSPTRRHHVH